MTDTFTAACPLCGRAAVFDPLTARKKHYLCKTTCTEFVVWSGAEHRLAAESEQRRQGLSELARRPPNEDHILVIRQPPVAGAAVAVLEAEFEPRSKALKR